MKKFLKNPKNFIVKIDEDMHRKLKDVAHSRDLSMGAIMRKLIEEFLKNEKAKQSLIS